MFNSTNAPANANMYPQNNNFVGGNMYSQNNSNVGGSVYPQNNVGGNAYPQNNVGVNMYPQNNNAGINMYPQNNNAGINMYPSNNNAYRPVYNGAGNRLPKKKTKVTFNAPVTLTFVIVCFVALILSDLTSGFTNDLLFSVYRSSLLNPFTLVRFFGHAIGHADWSHLLGNMMFILILGPLLEEKYGSKTILFIMVTTAFVTGVASFILFPDIQLLGASGIVFALILLSSFTSIGEGEIPLTFILVAILYIGEQVYDGLFLEDNISNFTHILGGICGAVFGYQLNKKKKKPQTASGTSSVSGNFQNAGNNGTYY